VRYTNLDPGEYVFRVIGSNNDGKWNEQGAAVRIRIAPPPWRAWWAYLIYTFGLISIGYSGYRYRLDAIEKRLKLERAAEIDKKNKELENKNAELARKNQELTESNNRADRIFSALAEALPGTVLDDKYRLDEKIGAGGFGAVYRATHMEMKRAVAVKIFKPQPGNDSADALERFRLEAVSASRINHANAVAVLDSGISSEGIAYLVMELLKGHTLTAELKRKKILSIERVAQILIPICDVLEKAHSMGIVHRDIKPDNIFLHRGEAGEVVKVVDFGIAKLTESSASIDARSLTATGGIIGTPTYMSPERLEGKIYDGRADVYSLGVLLYEMLCGRAPFRADSGEVIALVRMHLMKPPQPLREVNAQVPAAVERVVLRALEKSPQQRPTPKALGEEFLAAAGIDLAALAKFAEHQEDAFIYEEWSSEFAPTINQVSDSRLTANVFDQLGKAIESVLWLEFDQVAELAKDESISSPMAIKPKKSDLTPERWRQVKEIFFSAIDCDPDQRESYLNEVCHGDFDLRNRVEAMIEADGI
jgi:serine/threonine protein kinase